jgi:FG-GAP repeat
MNCNVLRAAICGGCAVVSIAACAADASPLVTGSDAGTPAHVKSFDGQTLAEQASFLAYGSFTGGVRVAAGDINGDGIADIVTGAGAGAAPHVKAFDGQTRAEFRSFFAFDVSVTGGVYVAVGDVTGDRRADLIAGVGGAAPAHVKVFDGSSLAEVRSFFAYPPTFTGGVRVAAGDVTGDGRADIVTGTGPGVASHVKVFDGQTLAEARSFFAYPVAFTGGVYVASGDVNGDGTADILTGTDTGVAGQVKVFDGQTLAEIRSFLPFGAEWLGGVRVGAGDLNADGYADILAATGPASGGPGTGTLVRAFDGRTGGELANFLPYGPSFTGGAFIAGETPVPEPVLTAPLVAGLALMGIRRRLASRAVPH